MHIVLNEPIAVRWPLPELTREGQKNFWDRQSAGYDSAGMTMDNNGELAIVRTLCDSYCRGNIVEDLVVLGGAVGSRDPIKLTDILEWHRKSPKQIFFNELSPMMIEVAQQKVLSSYDPQKIEVVTLPGAIHEIAHGIPQKPRRIIIGVYGLQALTRADPEGGYPHSGFNEYLRSADIVGTHLSFVPLQIENDSYSSVGERIDVAADDTVSQISATHQKLENCIRLDKPDAIRVIGLHPHQPGFFLSHWFSEQGVLKLVKGSFDSEKVSSIITSRCAKGWVVCIDPIKRPVGIVTMLNNVLGNVLPQEQAETLRAIGDISK